HAALPVPAADRLQGHDRRLDQHRRAGRAHERRDPACARRPAAGGLARIAGVPEKVGTMISRRVLLKDGAFALVSLGLAPSFLRRPRSAAGRTSRPRRLIAIFQRGAADGLNVVVPFGDPTSYRARPSIAIQRPGGGADTAVDLDGFFGFNPRLQALKP